MAGPFYAHQAFVGPISVARLSSLNNRPVFLCNARVFLHIQKARRYDDCIEGEPTEAAMNLTYRRIALKVQDQTGAQTISAGDPDSWFDIVARIRKIIDRA
jgi:hypothetical protein